MTPDEMDRLLASIGPRAITEARKAVKKGIDLLAKKQKEKAPVAKKPYRINGKMVKPGALKASIKGVMSKAGANIVKAKAGIEVGQKPGAGSAPHAHLIALGTDERFSGFKGKYKKVNRKTVIDEVKRTKNRIQWRGRIKPNPFIKTATQSAEAQVWALVISTLKAGIEKELTKQGA